MDIQSIWWSVTFCPHCLSHISTWLFGHVLQAGGGITWPIMWVPVSDVHTDPDHFHPTCPIVASASKKTHTLSRWVTYTHRLPPVSTLALWTHMYLHTHAHTHPPSVYLSQTWLSAVVIIISIVLCVNETLCTTQTHGTRPVQKL